MNELQYLRLMAEAPKVRFDAYIQTSQAQCVSDLMASIGDIRRLKAEWKKELPSLESFEGIVRQLNRRALINAAEHFDLADLAEDIDMMEALSSLDLNNADQQFEARLAFDEFFLRRDYIHLALQEFDLRGIQVPNGKRDELATLDQRSKSNRVVEWAASLPRPFFFLYTPASLAKLWWWTGESKPTRSIFRASLEWLRQVGEWSQLNPAPARARTNRDLRTLIKSAGPTWSVGDVLGAEVTVIPMEGQLWLAFARDDLTALELKSVAVDERPISEQQIQRMKGLLLVPLGLLGFRTADITAAEGMSVEHIAIRFGKKNR